jgi:hypothetical protein
LNGPISWLAGHNALHDSPFQALMPLDPETFCFDVVERTPEQAVRMKANPNWLHQPLSRINETGVASYMVEENQLPTRTKHAFHLCNRLAIVGYAAQRKSANHGVEAALGKGEGLGIADLEVDGAAQISRTLARDLEHGEA